MVLKISIYLLARRKQQKHDNLLGTSVARTRWFNVPLQSPLPKNYAIWTRDSTHWGPNRRLQGVWPLPVARAWIQLPKLQRKLTTLPNFFTSKLWATIDGFMHVLYCYIQLSSSKPGPKSILSFSVFPGRSTGREPRSSFFSFYFHTRVRHTGHLSSLPFLADTADGFSRKDTEVLFFLEILALHQKVKSEPSGGLKHYTRKRFQKKWVRKPKATFLDTHFGLTAAQKIGHCFSFSLATSYILLYFFAKRRPENLCIFSSPG